MKHAIKSLFLAGVLLAGTAAYGQYVAYDLGSFHAKGINDQGTMVGAYNGQAVQLQNGVITDLAPPGSDAVAINDNGEVLGDVQLNGGDAGYAFTYQNGTMTNLGVPVNFNSESVPTSINNQGTIVGQYYPGYPATNHAYIYQNGVMHDLGTLGGPNSWAVGIDNNGAVTGYSNTSTTTDAFIYQNGMMRDIGTLGGTIAEAAAINDSGTVAGHSTTAGNAVAHAFIYQNGAMTDLGTLGGSDSYATGINNNGLVVGYSDTASNQHAFTYQNGVMTDLEPYLTTIGLTNYETALGVNNLGEIYGYGATSNDIYHDYLLVPDGVTFIPPSSSEIPEPSSEAAIIGLIAVIGAAVRRWTSLA